MRLDHIAFRVADRQATAAFFRDAFGYRTQAEFDIDFDNGTRARCIALEPPEKLAADLPWTLALPRPGTPGGPRDHAAGTHHVPPEIFVSDGDPGSIVGGWVAARGGIGGVHHLAYMVDDVAATMAAWQARGWAEFSSPKPLECEGLTQVFSKPHALTGVIFEFIARGAHGFCAGNVKALMESTAKA
jgi:4-hydroxyphenylpyruvate dioxygenase-like putative hemolysin